MTFIAFCSVCLTGVHYGTGRHYWDLAEHDIQEALMVGVELSAQSPQSLAKRLTYHTVLVFLLHLVLRNNGSHQDLHWILPPTHHRRADTQLDYPRRHVAQRYHGHLLLIYYYFPMPPHFLLLEQESRRVLHQHRRHHRLHLPIQCF